MILSCKDFLLLPLLAVFIFAGLFLTRSYGYVIFNDMMSLSRSVPVTVGVGFIAVTISATWIRKRQGTTKKIKSLDEDIANLEERLHNIENSLDVKLMNLGFDITLKILENQSKQFNLQMEDNQTEMKNIKEKLQSLEMKIEEQEEDLREKQHLLDVQWKLEKRKEELEKLQLDTAKVLQSTEEKRLNILKGRKMKLKNERKQLNEKLEEKRKDREMLQQSWFLIF